MKCISLWEPWATLMANGAKKIETRSWPTSHRGLLAIHAAKKWNRKLEELCFKEPFYSKLSALRPNQSDCFFFDRALKQILSLGCIIATVELVDCVKIDFTNQPTDEETPFGDYAIGRYMWKTQNPTVLQEPVPYKGSQGFFNVPDEFVTFIW